MDEETIKRLIEAFDKAEEVFMITKEDDAFRLVHSNLSDAREWVEMIEHFKQNVQEQINDDNDALDDLLGGFGISSN